MARFFVAVQNRARIQLDRQGEGTSVKGLNSNIKCPIFRVYIVLTGSLEKSLNVAGCLALPLCCL